MASETAKIHEAVAAQIHRPVPVPASEAPRADMIRLAALHHEAEENALLANLLGRAPYVAAFLALAAVLVAAPAAAAEPLAPLVVWLALMALGLGAAVRAYARTIGAPFERASLHRFAQDLGAVLTYMGFAWGAGGFLALPVTASPLEAAAFAALPPALVALSLRNRVATLQFLAPATLLSAFAMVLRPLPDGALASALTLLAAAVVAGGTIWLDHRPGRGQSLLRLAELPFGKHRAL
ncbi:MAG: hypothetical protein KGL26_01690 [Pseudomonadota bacterium]|nr:hypothetical protein [Pseudomonadota bacterium]